MALQAGATVDGSPVVTEDSFGMKVIQNRPTGLDDGDNDTQLTDSDIVSAVESTSVSWLLVVH